VTPEPLPHTTADRRAGEFITTREHRRFCEFADAVRRHGYIGLCYGPAGVGKTLSARRYARWDTAGAWLEEWGPRDPERDAAAQSALAQARAVFYTPDSSLTTVKVLDSDLNTLTFRTDLWISEHVNPEHVARPRSHRDAPYVELIIVDEAERLRPQALGHLRARFDRSRAGLILIGMPGIEKRLARYPQLYSRIGFAHHYQPLGQDELTFVLTRHWRQFGLELDTADFSDAQAIAAIARITGGNFRLIHRLFVQIERILRINELTSVTSDVVEVARSTLVIGDTGP
jgi:DNA transposition AAA+ family ATPase